MRSRYVYEGGEVVAEYQGGELVYCAPKFSEEAPKSFQVLPDIAPYKSMVDGSEITSRSRHREHLKAHGLIEVGNELHHMKQRPVTTPPGLKETVGRLVYDRLRYK
jgi:hypothetical protein